MILAREDSLRLLLARLATSLWRLKQQPRVQLRRHSDSNRYPIKLVQLWQCWNPSITDVLVPNSLQWTPKYDLSGHVLSPGPVMLPLRLYTWRFTQLILRADCYFSCFSINPAKFSWSGRYQCSSALQNKRNGEESVNFVHRWTFWEFPGSQ